MSSSTEPVVVGDARHASSSEGKPEGTPTGRLGDRTLRLVAWAMFVAIWAGAIASLWLDRLNGRGGDDISGAVFLLSYPTVGILLATRRPRNPLGWLMLFAALGFAFPGESYARYAEVTRGGELPGAGLSLAIGGPTWVPFIGLSGFLLMVFPDGHLPSPRWRWFAWLCGVGLTAIFLLIMFAPGDIGADFQDLPPIRNPIGIDAIAPYVDQLVFLALFAPLTVAGGAVGMIVRRRRTSDPVVHEQIRWVTWGAGVIGVAYVFAFLPQLFGIPPGSEQWENWLGTVAVTTFTLIPITIGIAVLRRRLYDIDVVIRKTVIYVLLALLIVAIGLLLLWAVVAAANVFSASVESGRLDLIVGAIVGLLFWPLRRLATWIADRIVFGGRATPYEVLAEFGDRLAGTYAADDVLERTARVLGEGVGAERARVWLSEAGDLRPVATWSRESASLAGPDARPDDLRVDVRHQGEVLGALSVTMPPNDPMDPTKEKLVADLAAQAGLLLRNVRLVEDLRASRRRLVAAQDQERRRLERNIHDGAQQQLVALAVKARLARQLAERDPAKAAEMLEQIEGETQTALEDLRDLARGIYPPLLADRGLPAALEAQARKVGFPVEVRGADVGRLDEEVEAAVYFSCLEALQNVAKYAEASGATITLSRANGVLEFVVADDGRGFDPSTGITGSGLRGMSDRLTALDGALEVRSAPGAGTKIVGRLPVAGRAGATT